MAYAAQEHPRSRPTAPPCPTAPDTSVAVRQNEDQEASAVFSAFQKLYDKAYAIIQKGLNADEEGNVADAQQYYICSLPVLEESLMIDFENWSGASPAEKETARQMQLKMNKTKLQITYRLESIQTNEQVASEPETSFFSEVGEGVRLPSYEEAVSSGPSSPLSETGHGNVMPSCDRAGEHLTTDGTELFSIPDGVQIFHITCEGYVSAPSYPTSLHIVKFQESVDSDGESQSRAPSAAHAFVQVGDWVYPLIPGASPVLHTTFGAYLFPDLSPEGSGSSVGLILPDTLSQEDHHILEDILRNFSAIQDQQIQELEEGHTVHSAPGLESQDASVVRAETEAREEEVGRPGAERSDSGAGDHCTSAKISRGIIVASSWISWGLGKGAEKAGQWISYGSEKLRDRLHPEAVPQPVDPRLQKGAMYARKATNTAVSVSAFIVTKLGEATMALGRQVAPHIRRKGEELLPKSVKTDENKSRLDGVIEVAASGLKGLGTVWLSLEAAAKALGRSVAQETVATVHHKYGEDASKLAENTVYAAGNVAMTAYNAESLAVRAIIKRTAKDAGAAVVYDMRGTNKECQTNGHGTGASHERSGGEDCQVSEKKDSKSPV